MSGRLWSTTTGLYPRVVQLSTKRVVLVAKLDSQWVEIVRTLERKGIEFDILPLFATTADVISCATRSECAVVVADLSTDVSGGLAIVSACRRAAPLVPVIVVAANPSLDLTRALRLSGTFYLALHPVGAEEMGSSIESAFQSLERRCASATRCRARRRILIIDDDRDFRASTSALLEAHGYSVSAAGNGRQGLEMLLAEHPDLIVLDLMMEHDGSGYEVNQTVRYDAGFECVRHVPILMVSSVPVGPPARIPGAAEATPSVCLAKPLDVPRFLAQVSDQLGEERGESVLEVPR
jgi:CheY-like chemotaxis protein